MNSETTPTNSTMRTLVDCFCKIVHHHRWIQRPGITLVLLLIVLAFLVMVQHSLVGQTVTRESLACETRYSNGEV